MHSPTPIANADIGELYRTRLELRDRVGILTPTCRSYRDLAICIDLELSPAESLSFTVREDIWWWISRHTGPAGQATSPLYAFVNPTHAANVDYIIELATTELQHHIQDLTQLAAVDLSNLDAVTQAQRRLDHLHGL